VLTVIWDRKPYHTFLNYLQHKLKEIYTDELSGDRRISRRAIILMSQSHCPVCGNLNDINQRSCFNCGFPLTSPSEQDFMLKPKKSAEAFQDLVDWAKKIYEQFLLLQNQSVKSQQDYHSLPQTSQTTFSEDSMTEFMDSSEVEEYSKLLNKIQQVEQEKADIQSKFHILAKEINELSRELPKHIIVDHRSEKKLQEIGSDLLYKIQEWNNQRFKFLERFRPLERELPQLKRELEIYSAQYPDQSNYAVTPPGNLRHQETAIQTAKLEQEELQLQALIEELKQITLQLQSQVNHTAQERSPFVAELQNWNQYVSQLFPLLETRFSEKITSLKTEILAEIKNLSLSTQENLPQPTIATVENGKDYGYEVSPTLILQPQEKFSHQSSAFSQLPWISKYNENPDFCSEFALEVSVTEESINQRRLGNNQAIVIEKVRKGRGSYWLFNDNGENYLVPKGDLKITQFNLPTVEALFQCRGDSPENSDELKLIQPATVFPIESDKWQLQERGVLQF
jgi:predicted small metal-binding protein